MKKILFTLLILLFAAEIFSQAPTGEFSYRQWSQENDTLIVQRKYGDWWFGARIGTNRNYYFGTLEYTTNNDPGNPFKRIVKFDVGDGGGAIYGGIIEYLPIGEKWGYGVNFNIMEVREVNTSSDPLKDTFQTYYDFKSNLNYIVVSPFARLNFLFPGLFAYSGLDVAINTSQNTSFLKKFQNSGKIEQWQKENLTDLPISIGFHVGFGYDFFLADISEKARTRLTPFLSLNMNSSVIGDNNSTWSGLQLKMGFAVKLGFDRIDYDTIYQDRDYIPKPSYIASINKGIGVEFDGFRSYREFVSAELDTLPSQIFASADVKEPDNKLPDVEKVINVKKYKLNAPLRYSFTGSTTTDLSNDLKNEIKGMSEFLKNNPNIRVKITGHSDDAGTIPQNTTRSRLRAEKTRQEFINNGVRANRIEIDFKGSLDPIDNRRASEDARRNNRRVEIIFN